MPKIETARIAILATDGFERSELHEPYDFLKSKGATVDIVSLKKGDIKSWDENDWGDTIAVDKTLDEVSVEDYDALVLPGGQINPDLLRVETKAVDLVRAFAQSGKTLAAICHGPWLLVEANVVRDRDVTSYPSIKTDVLNAGGRWTDREVVVDEGIVTSRNPKDLPAFNAKIVEEIEEGRHQRGIAAE
ncbi:type 1 glutamine amidotransferase domain-containing protein [Pararhizobium haloflavum]|uniref:type 1 glutamine amidotransferase domain-containing protein n=1 Tax=Pararhizobium haloflavum TaxID=2037914 RepID=UPI000C18E91D|nr:type 1 glutamine amidotransferase domain-containing protein [Pararhizobium haloflavum]